MSQPKPNGPPSFPYKIATLCELRDSAGRILLIHRRKDPNRGLYSPIGGKLDTASGESPAQSAQREIHEEAGIHVPLTDLHLAGIISERGFGGSTNWLMFWYRVTRPVALEAREIEEGTLGWHSEEELDSLALPDTDRTIIWPVVRKHAGAKGHDGRGFFALHIDCTGPALTWSLEESRP